MENLVTNCKFWKNKKVLITGHSGFKGSWLTIFLKMLGAKVYGYALKNGDKNSIYHSAYVKTLLEKEMFGDICDPNNLSMFMDYVQPEIIFHLAAQPLVRESYKHPVETFNVNVIGLANVLQKCRDIHSLKTIINVTSDKCYLNNEWPWPYREIDHLGGHDPYSASKACAELVSLSFAQSYYKSDKALATVRAGNVIGGGDYSKDRLIPDYIRAKMLGTELRIRSPNSTRPWQHVLEPLSGYLELAEKLDTNPSKYSGAWNFGPNFQDIRTVSDIVELLSQKIDDVIVKIESGEHVHEATTLALDSSKAHNYLGWQPRLTVRLAVDRTCDWYIKANNEKHMLDFSMKQIENYVSN